MFTAAPAPRNPAPAPPGTLARHPSPCTVKTPEMADKGTDRTTPTAAARRPWTAPRVEELPPLTRLTLVTGPIEGNCGTGGSTCF